MDLTYRFSEDERNLVGEFFSIPLLWLHFLLYSPCGSACLLFKKMFIVYKDM